MNITMIINYGICGAIILLLLIVTLILNGVDNQLRKLNDNFKSTQCVIDRINSCVNAINNNGVEFKKVLSSLNNDQGMIVVKLNEISRDTYNIGNNTHKINQHTGATYGVVDEIINRMDRNKLSALNDEELLKVVRKALDMYTEVGYEDC